MAKKSTYPPRPRQRRILYIITKSVWAGAAKYVFDLATNLSDEFEVSVAAGGQNRLARKIKEKNIPYFEIYNFQRNIHIFKEIFSFFEVLSLIFQLKPDIIHTNSSKAGGIAGVAGWLYKILSGQKLCLVFTAHGWALTEDRPRWQIRLIKFFSKLTVLFYDKIICVSDYDRHLAVQNKIAPADKLISIHNGIDIKAISFLSREQAQQKLLGQTSSLVIGTIAEWTKNKGLFYLLKAAKRIKESFALVLIGSGENPDKEKIYDYVKKHNLKNVHLIEFIPEAASYLKAFDIFVLPSVKEGLPYTILEAMAAQVPIIATRVGGIPEMIKKDCGLLIPSKNSRQLAEKILYLINSPKKGQRMTQRAEQRVNEEFSLEKMVEQTKNVYLSKMPAKIS